MTNTSFALQKSCALRSLISIPDENLQSSGENFEGWFKNNPNTTEIALSGVQTMLLKVLSAFCVPNYYYLEVQLKTICLVQLKAVFNCAFMKEIKKVFLNCKKKKRHALRVITKEKDQICIE